MWFSRAQKGLFVWQLEQKYKDILNLKQDSKTVFSIAGN